MPLEMWNVLENEVLVFNGSWLAVSNIEIKKSSLCLSQKVASFHLGRTNQASHWHEKATWSIYIIFDKAGGLLIKYSYDIRHASASIYPLLVFKKEKEKILLVDAMMGCFEPQNCESILAA